MPPATMRKWTPKELFSPHSICCSTLDTFSLKCSTNCCPHTYTSLYHKQKSPQQSWQPSSSLNSLPKPNAPTTHGSVPLNFWTSGPSNPIPNSAHDISSQKLSLPPRHSAWDHTLLYHTMLSTEKALDSIKIDSAFPPTIALPAGQAYLYINNALITKIFHTAIMQAWCTSDLCQYLINKLYWHITSTNGPPSLYTNGYLSIHMKEQIRLLTTALSTTRAQKLHSTFSNAVWFHHNNNLPSLTL